MFLFWKLSFEARSLPHKVGDTQPLYVSAARALKHFSKQKQSQIVFTKLEKSQEITK